jgi:Tol biopolymer transport system component
LDRITLKCLEKDADLRYQSAKDLGADLRRLEIGNTRAVSALPLPTASRRQRWIRAAAVVAVAGLVALGLVLAPSIPRDGGAASTSVRWEPITNFTNSASVLAISPDGQTVAFIRGQGRFGGSIANGDVWIKTLPDGDAVQLTNTSFSKHTLAFAPDGSRIYFTQLEGRFQWNTYEVSLNGGLQQPRRVMPNTTGLTFIGKDRVLFSEMKEGIHMALATSNLSRTDKRDLYVPPDMTNGMVHRSALSPDGKSVLAGEMDSRWWVRCRLLPFDGSSAGRPVGPDGSCTAAQWSPDGKWMYFTADSGSTGFHVWRQRFPDGAPEQLTARGAAEEEGLTVFPDGKSLITAAGAQEASIWIRDESGPRQITSEGFAFLPTLSPDGKRLYYLRRAPGSRSFLNGELYTVDFATGRAAPALPGIIMSHYSLSHDGATLVYYRRSVEARRVSGWLTLAAFKPHEKSHQTWRTGCSSERPAKLSMRAVRAVAA